MPFTIIGKVLDRTTGAGAAGVRVEAWDKDVVYNDYLGHDVTDAEGNFRITFSEYFFFDLFTDHWPDLYFKVFYEGAEIASTEDSVIWNVRSPTTEVTIEVDLPPAKEEWVERDIYLKIERIENYSPVRPEEKAPPPIQYGRDCMRFEGHEDGSIPEAEIEARAMTAVVFREYLDAGYLFPKTDKLIAADINEPVYSHRVPGTVIYTRPCERLRIHVWNCDDSPHSLHVHGLRYGIDSDGAWPFGVESEDGRRSDEICPGQTWTYTFEVDEDMMGVWPFHTHSGAITASINRGLFGGIVVLPKDEKPPTLTLLPEDYFDGILTELVAREGRQGLHVDALRPENRVFLNDHLQFLEELIAKELVVPRMPSTDHVPVFFHLMANDESVALFDSGDLAELVGVFEHTFNEEGNFEYFCTFHPMMTGMVHVMAGGPANVTVNIVDGPPMAFSPDMVTVGVGGTVRWENHSILHHTVTSKDGASLSTHCINGRGFVGNSPTIVARSGQCIRWYVFNLDIGLNWHNFHPHAMRWKFAGENIDVRSIGPAESFRVETEAPPVLLLTDEMKQIQDPEHRPEDAKLYRLKGDYIFHCHVHHHLMNGMVGLVRSKQRVWLTDAMVEELKQTQGFPLDDGLNACPDIDVDRCKKRGEGRWEEVTGDPEVAFMHSILLPQTNKVLYWGYTRADQTRLWDYSTSAGSYGTPANQPASLPGHDINSSDLWSGAHSFLDTPEGLVLANGGFTPNHAFIFNPAAETWSATSSTAHNRFYATTKTLPDGRIITLFGSASKSIEAYTHGGPGWDAPIAMPADYNHHVYYPWTSILPDGRLFIAGPHVPTQRFDWTAPAGPESFPTIGGNRSTGGEKGTSVMLILRPPDYKPQVIIAGGNTATTEKTAETIDLSASPPVWTALPDLNVARAQQFTGVLLPDGRVFIAGGVGGPDGGPSEIYDPQDPGAGWQLGPTMTYVRTYHSSIILLADGSVLAGGDPMVGGVPTPHERYFPDYFTVPRPTISNAPATINYGSTFTIDTPEASTIGEVVLLYPGAVTHGYNMTQRGVECVITGGGVTSIDVQTPPNANLAPPGWHLLFILDGNRVPSVGRWIRLTP